MSVRGRGLWSGTTRNRNRRRLRDIQDCGRPIVIVETRRPLGRMFSFGRGTKTPTTVPSRQRRSPSSNPSGPEVTSESISDSIAIYDSDSDSESEPKADKQKNKASGLPIYQQPADSQCRSLVLVSHSAPLPTSRVTHSFTSCPLSNTKSKSGAPSLLTCPLSPFPSSPHLPSLSTSLSTSHPHTPHHGSSPLSLPLFVSMRATYIIPSWTHNKRGVNVRWVRFEWTGGRTDGRTGVWDELSWDED